MDRAKCPGCGKILQAEDTIFQVKAIYADGQTFWNPCCSEECAEQIKEKFAAIHRRRLHDMEHQSFQKMPLSKFGT